LRGKSYDEMYRTDGMARSHYLRYGEWLEHQPADVRHGGGGESMEAAVMVAESAQQQQQ
jgi:hypothetical protein